MKKSILLILAVLAFGVLFAVAYLWQLSGWFQPVEWTAAEGTLRLHYMPGKDQVAVSVTDAYVEGSDRDWVLVCSGATQRRWGAPSCPPPENLFQRADVSATRSGPAGLVALYDDVNDRQKAQISEELGDLCGRSQDARRRLQQLAADRNLTWLENILQEQDG